MDQERAKFYPNWLIMQFPAITVIRDNPLAQFLAGRAYGRRRWFRRSQAMPPAPIEAYLMQPILAAAIWGIYSILDSVFLTAFALFVILPTMLIAWRYAVWEHWWRRMTQVINLQEWHLSMAPKDIALGIAWGAILRSLRGHCIAAIVWPSLLIATHFASMRMTNSSPNVIYYVFAVIIIFLLQWAVLVDSIYSIFVSLSVGGKWASRPIRGTPFLARFKAIASGAIHQWFRLGFSAIAGFVLGALMGDIIYMLILLLLIPLGISGPASSYQNEIILIGMIGACSLGWFVSFYALFIRRLMDSDYYQAVDTESFDLRDIFEANSAGPGGNS
ncbi:MAG: hypothetical protein NTX50_29770 [Candidatus Sumerlaeota bacterium]|nr:hypothetical protein [Candidatus Sumerlaeota bacterium]